MVAKTVPNALQISKLLFDVENKKQPVKQISNPPSWDAYFFLNKAKFDFSEDLWMNQRFCNRMAGSWDFYGFFGIAVLILSQDRFYQLDAQPSGVFVWNQHLELMFQQRKGKFCTHSMGEISAKPARFQTINETASFERRTWNSESTRGGALHWGGPGWDGNAMAAPPEGRSVVWPQSPGSKVSSCGEGSVTRRLFGYVPKLRMIHQVSPFIFCDESISGFKIGLLVVPICWG